MDPARRGSPATRKRHLSTRRSSPLLWAAAAAVGSADVGCRRGEREGRRGGRGRRERRWGREREREREEGEAVGAVGEARGALVWDEAGGCIELSQCEAYLARLHVAASQRQPRVAPRGGRERHGTRDRTLRTLGGPPIY
eukprot:scaffold297048_cov26-Tisochrysis_lutea.AAC.1